MEVSRGVGVVITLILAFEGLEAVKLAGGDGAFTVFVRRAFIYKTITNRQSLAKDKTCNTLRLLIPTIK